MHRPGIANVYGDRIVLGGTTIDEVEEYHLATLKLAIDEANRLSAQYEEKERARRQTEAKRSEEHKKNIDEIAKRLKLD